MITKKTWLSNKCMGYGLAVLVLASWVQVSVAQNIKKMNDGSLLLENFQQDNVGSLPAGWYDRDGNKKLVKLNASERAKYKYHVQQENGNKYLQYEGKEAMHINLPLINKHKDNIYHININKTPILSWKWKAITLPKDANENDDERNDVVASVYVIWGFGHVLFKKVPKSVRYTWSSTLPKGKELSKFFGNQQIVVLESGSQDAGQWITENRNIAKDYKRLFGDDPPQAPLAILILSDGDSTHSMAEADYDDIMLKPENEPIPDTN